MTTLTGCMTCATPAAMMGVIGTGGVLAAPFASLLLLGGVLDWSKGKREKAELDARFRKVHAALERIREAQQSDSDWRGLVDELLGERIREAELRDPRKDLEALQAQISDHSESVEQGFEHCRIYLSSISDRLDQIQKTLGSLDNQMGDVVEGVARLEPEVRKIAKDQETIILALSKANQSLSLTVESLQAERASLREALEAANMQLAQDRLREGRSVDEVLSELRDKDPAELVEALVEEAEAGDQALEQAKQAMLDEVRRSIERHRAIATIAYPIGEIERAERSLRRLLELAQDDLDALTRMGRIQVLRGQLEEAKDTHNRVLELAENEHDRAAALGNLGLIERRRGNLDAAEGHLTQSLEINEALGIKEGVAACYGNLGVIERTCGNLDAAESFFTRSLEISESLGCKEGMANQLNNLGLIERTRGNLDAAEGYLAQSLDINEALGNKEGMAADLGNLGLIERMRGNLDAAEGYHTQSLKISETLGYKEGIAIQLGNLGVIEMARGNLDAARDKWIRACNLFHDIGMPHMVEKTKALIEELDG